MPDDAMKIGNDLSRLVEASTQALTDSMVERLSITAANALEVVDKLNEPDTKDAILSLIDRLTELHRAGALDTAIELIYTLHAARNAVNDSIVERLFVFLEHMVNNLGNEELAILAHNARRAMEEAVDDTAGAKAGGGLFTTLGMLSKPETQKAMQFLMAFACRLQQRTESVRGTPVLEEAPRY